MVRSDLQMQPVRILSVLYKGKDGMGYVYIVEGYKRYNKY